MIAILTTHPIQYQVPLWKMLAREGVVPFEVWYLSDHATRSSRDSEFGQDFAWDLDMLEGYPHRFLRTPSGATPITPIRSRIVESLPDLFRETKAKVLWVQGWQVAAYWQAVWAAHRAGLQVWMRGESNAMAPTPWWKRAIKRPLLGSLFRRVDHFLCIGEANCELYRSYGVPEAKLHMAPYAVDNERFAAQAKTLRGQPPAHRGLRPGGKFEIRKQWGISERAFVVLFCGKFIPKKRPLDIVKAAQSLITNPPTDGFAVANNHIPNIHLLFAGSGELGAQLRAHCNVVFDAENPHLSPVTCHSSLPPASFAGFLNQTEISRAYVAADVLVLPSEYSETWGLVVNEAMASGLPCIISDRCGSAPDLGTCTGNAVYSCGDIAGLADRIAETATKRIVPPQPPSLHETVGVARALYTAT